MKVEYPLDSGTEVAWMFINWIINLTIWSVENSGTVGMFILTLFVVVYSRRTLKVTQRTVEISEMNYKDAKKPDVIAYCDIENNYYLYFFVKNIGVSPALNININFETLRGDLSSTGFLDVDMLRNEVAMLVPNQNLRCFIDGLSNLQDNEENFPKFKVELTYHDKEGESYNDWYILDMNMFKGLSQVTIKGVHELTKEVHQIRKTLEKKDKKNMP